MKRSNVRYTTDDEGRIGRIVLDRRPANAFDLAFYAELNACILELRQGPFLPGCVLIESGIERFFSAGRDLKEPSPVDEVGWMQRHAVVGDLYRNLYDFPRPLIALVDGYALGTGCVLASLCDIRVATHRAEFGLPEVRAGSVGGTRNLLRLLPQGTVRRMAFTGESITGSRAYELGFVDDLVDPGDLRDAGIALARRIATHEPEILGQIKRTMNDVEALSLWDGYEVEQSSARGFAARRRGP